MVSITIPLPEEVKLELDRFPWVNWSEVGREDLLRKEIFEDYMETGELSKEAEEFCESIDWHPVDELPFKEEFIKEVLKRAKEPSIKVKSVDEIFEK